MHDACMPIGHVEISQARAISSYLT